MYSNEGGRRELERMAPVTSSVSPWLQPMFAMRNYRPAFATFSLFSSLRNLPSLIFVDLFAISLSLQNIMLRNQNTSVIITSSLWPMAFSVIFCTHQHTWAHTRAYSPNPQTGLSLRSDGSWELNWSDFNHPWKQLVFPNSLFGNKLCNSPIFHSFISLLLDICQ